MEAFASYLIKSTVWLTGFALVYLLFLRNERFFLLNRIYLVAGILVSIVFPLFTWHYTVLLPAAPTIEVSDLQMVGIADIPEPFPTQAILLYIYMAGALYLLFRVTRQTTAVIRVIQKSEILPYRSAKLIRTAEYPASFSFFSFVFVNPSTCDTETNEIVNHEMEHVRQQHWIDLLLFELLCTLQWFNPLSWLYGRFIRQNHEYLADERALQRSSNPGIYRAALLNQMFGGPVITLANSFSYSLNKKRFNMMKQTIYSPIRKLKLLLVLPLMAGVFYAFATPEYKYTQADNNSINAAQDIKTVTGKVVNADGIPLKGANLFVAGKNIGTVTNANGQFKLELTDDTPLFITYVGFESQKVAPNFDQEMLISLKPIVIAMGEATVTSGTETFKIQTNSPLKFMNSDGSKGQPLYVKDGVITDLININNIPPESIESISVLKGESATALYGEKGKNGVILLTMKKGTNFKNEIIDVQITRDTETQKESKVYTQVEVMPEFLGGDIALRNFLASTLKYPSLAYEKGIQGKVIVSFVVTETGTVSNAHVVRSVDPSLDREALRVVNLLPTWKPGQQNGENVSVEYTLPINFALEGKKTAEVKPADQPYTVVEEMPTFPGGEEGLRKFLSSTVKYPAEAAQKGIQGKVYVNFVVTNTGTISNAKVVRGVDPLLDQEALRVVNLSPTWTPGKQKGENVSVSYTVPINFVLNNAKTEAPKTAENEVYMVVEEMPEFPGGQTALRNFLASTVKYPAEAMQKGIQGKVYVNFVVTKTGSVTNAKVVRGVDALLDQEALRVVNLLPTWIPGKQKGENVAVSYTVPINFVLNNEAPIMTFVEQMPSFPGGEEAMNAYLSNSMKYPTIALENGIHGQVYVKFVVDKTGSITNVKISRGVDTSLDQEAMRIVNSMPKWNPGKQNGENVAVALELPINFKLPADWNNVKEKLHVSYQTGIKPEDQAKENHKLIYNGSAGNGKIKFTLENSDYTGELEVSIFDKDGKLVRKELKNGPSFILTHAGMNGYFTIYTKVGSTQYIGSMSVATTTVTSKSATEKKAAVKPTVNQAAQNHELIIVPNPPKDKAMITLKDSDYSSKLEVSVYDNYGKLISTEFHTGPTFTMIFRHLTNGTYFIVAKAGTNQFSGQLIVTH